MGSRLVGEWMAFWRLEPRGEARADMRSAMMTAVLYNVQVEREHRREVEDFMLKFEPNPPNPGAEYSDSPFPEGEGGDEQEAWRGLLAKVVGLNAALGGEDLRTT